MRFQTENLKSQHPNSYSMSNYQEKLKKNAAAWILKSLYTNDLWYETTTRRNSPKNYLFIPLFDLSQASTRYDLHTLREACYMLQDNSHLTVWGDDYDSRAMLVQISEEGTEAYKRSIYAPSNSLQLKKGFTAVVAATAVAAMVIGFSKHGGMKQQKSSSHVETKARYKLS